MNIAPFRYEPFGDCLPRDYFYPVGPCVIFNMNHILEEVEPCRRLEAKVALVTGESKGHRGCGGLRKRAWHAGQGEWWSSRGRISLSTKRGAARKSGGRGDHRLLAEEAIRSPAGRFIMYKSRSTWRCRRLVLRDKGARAYGSRWNGCSRGTMPRSNSFFRATRGDDRGEEWREKEIPPGSSTRTRWLGPLMMIREAI